MADKYISLENELLTYEQTYQQTLQTKVPVFLRINGKAFGTFTKNLQKPFDKVFSNAINCTMKALCASIPGCVFGYAAADEIVIILTDYKHWNSVPWLNYDVNMINSTIAATASYEFNKAFFDEVQKLKLKSEIDVSIYESAATTFAIMTCKCFNVPEDRVCDIMLWLQCDHRRKAIQKLARMHIDRKRLLGMCNDEIVADLRVNHQVEWASMPNEYQIGSACIKMRSSENDKEYWHIDTNMPMLKGHDRNYLQDILSSIRKD